MQSLTNSPLLIVQHLVYLCLALNTTVWVGRTISTNGAAFLADTFLGKEVLAEAVNRLLLAGFYLVNFGWVVRTLKDRVEPWTPAQLTRMSPAPTARCC
jgi:hypothetical protein